MPYPEPKLGPDAAVVVLLDEAAQASVPNAPYPHRKLPYGITV
jgi:hypothetical protein